MMTAMNPRRVLFLCTGNSCRSQMAEGWARELCGDSLEVYSAGIEAHGLNPIAVEVMAEAGVDISGQRSNTVDDLPTREFDLVVTVCDDASQNCPVWLGEGPVFHYGFDDPPRLAVHALSSAEAKAIYRRVRDEIREFAGTLPRIVEEHGRRSV